jgi:hypothetical protein
MTPDISVMRQFVSDMYSGPRWKHRVSRMPDDQVIAIYFREQAKEKPAEKEKESDDDDIPF